MGQHLRRLVAPVRAVLAYRKANESRVFTMATASALLGTAGIIGFGIAYSKTWSPHGLSPLCEFFRYAGLSSAVPLVLGLAVGFPTWAKGPAYSVKIGLEADARKAAAREAKNPATGAPDDRDVAA